MIRTRYSVKRQKLVTVESALLFNPDVMFLLASLLDVQDLCQASLTCCWAQTGNLEQAVTGRGGIEADVSISDWKRFAKVQ